MKIIALMALALLQLALFGCAIAEREHFQSGQFDISFEMKKAHEVGYIEDGIKIKTSSSYAEVKILEDKSGLSLTSLDQMINLIGGMAGTTEDVRIDGKDGKVITATRGGYIILYSPVDGYYALIDCTLSGIETTLFMKSLQIEPNSYAQSVVVYPGNDNLTSNQSSQEDAILAAQIEVDNLLGHSQGMSLSAYWTAIGDSLWRNNNTIAAIDAYDNAIELNPYEGSAGFHRSMVIQGQTMPEYF